MTEITERLVARLVAAQFPEWRHLPVASVAEQGNDNRTFRLGHELSVRLPSAAGYVASVAKEDRWLPYLAPMLSLPVPEPVAVGAPSDDYPFPWSIRRWLPGETLTQAADVDRPRLASELGAFLTELRAVPAAGGPLTGRGSFHRGAHPKVYGDEVTRALETLGDRVDGSRANGARTDGARADGSLVDTERAREIWHAAEASAWEGAPVWFHGDIAAGNLLVNGNLMVNRPSGAGLSAVIDFGTCGVGDPACDLVIAWTSFSADERMILRDAIGLDDDTWRRARAWALWKALITAVETSSLAQSRVLQEVLGDTVLP